MGFEGDLEGSVTPGCVLRLTQPRLTGGALQSLHFCCREGRKSQAVRKECVISGYLTGWSNTSLGWIWLTWAVTETQEDEERAWRCVLGEKAYENEDEDVENVHVFVKWLLRISSKWVYHLIKFFILYKMLNARKGSEAKRQKFKFSVWTRQLIHYVKKKKANLMLTIFFKEG